MRAATLCSILLLVSVAKGYAADVETTPKPGRYVPELYGAHRGRYITDESGKYRHVHKPYDGGYGDRGEPYFNDFRSFIENGQQENGGGRTGLSLGPQDHLRFMIDFNYNGTGWQIVQFEWVRDGEDKRKYNYVNENRLWTNDMPAVEDHAYDYEQPAAHEEQTETDQNDKNVYEQSDNQEQDTRVHVDGSYDQEQQSYDVRYSKENGYASEDPNKIKYTINEVLEYIQQHILPTLN